MRQGFRKRHPLGRRPGVEPPQAGVTHTPPGHVQDPFQGHLIVRVGDGVQISEHVLYFSALVEARAPDDLVGNALAHQFLFDSPALGIGPVENGHVSPPVALVPAQPHYFSRQPRALVVLVLGDVTDQLFTAISRRPQILRFAGRVVRDHCIGGVEDPLGRAVVLVKHNDGGVGEGALELQDVPYVGPPPAVNRLVGVAHHGHLVVTAGQLQDEFVLRPVSVLVLVDQNVQKTVPISLEDPGVFPEKTHRQQQEVVEVHGVGSDQTTLVLLVDVRDFPLENRAAAGTVRVLRGAQELVLGPGDGCMYGSRWEFLSVQADIPHDITSEPHGISLVVNRERRLVAEDRGLSAQYAHTRRMKGRHPHPLRHPPDELPDAVAHFVRRFIRERYGQDRKGRQTFFPHQPRNSVGQHSGFTGAGTGHDE